MLGAEWSSGPGGGSSGGCGGRRGWQSAQDTREQRCFKQQSSICIDHDRVEYNSHDDDCTNNDCSDEIDDNNNNDHHI